MLLRKNRLNKKEIEAVLSSAKNKRTVVGAVKCVFSEEKETKATFVVSKKTVKRGVDRKRILRVARHHVKDKIKRIKNKHMVFFLYSQNKNEVRRDLDKALNSLYN